jgi:hypothetical protein
VNSKSRRQAVFFCTSYLVFYVFYQEAGVVRFFIVFILFFCLSGCSGTWRTYKDMISYAWTEVPDKSFSLAEIQNYPYDLMYIRLDDKPQAILVLASSADVVFTFQHGRLIKTYGLANDLLYAENSGIDPLTTLYQQPGSFQRLTDWALNNESGYPQLFSYQQTNNETIELEGQSLQTRKVSEQVTFADGSTAVNYFWFSLDKAVLVKSEQQIAPFGPRLTLTYVSRIARLL